MCGVLGGLTVAEILFKPFPLSSSPSAHAMRIVLGLFVLMSSYFAVRLMEKKMARSNYNRLGLVLRFFRFAQVPPIILQVVPVIFEALGI